VGDVIIGGGLRFLGQLHLALGANPTTHFRLMFFGI